MLGVSSRSRVRLRGPAAFLLGLVCALAAGHRAGADSSPSALLSLDQYLLRADFMGEVVVADQSWDKASGLQRVRFTVVDPWFTRWAVGAS